MNSGGPLGPCADVKTADLIFLEVCATICALLRIYGYAKKDG
jgi:hypothetical protein